MNNKEVLKDVIDNETRLIRFLYCDPAGVIRGKTVHSSQFESKLEEAYNIAKAAGLNYVYVGNVPGNPGENTYCPNCKKIVVGRTGYLVTQNNIADGKCKFCGHKIAGVWE